MIGDFLTHVVVSSLILLVALAAATWIRPLTARTRHAILAAGLLALVLPAPLISTLLERNEITTLPRLTGGALFNPAPATPGTPKPAAPPVRLLATIWLGVAAVLLLRWWIVTRRLVHTALRSAAPPPPRAVRALDAARQRLSLRHSIDLITSATCEAPAVVRVLRPMIILPADGCDALNDEELESLLCHECAHVARRDNLLGVIEAVACSLFWFNPLVWLAHHRIAAVRETACDERVADAALPAETYVGALSKICRTLLAPRVAAVSCMASAHLKERIQHLMSYERLRKSAFSHRFIAAGSMLAVVLAVAAAGVVTADPVSRKAADKATEKSPERYHLNYSMHRLVDGEINIRVQVLDGETGKSMGAPAVVSTKPGGRATVHFGESRDGYERDILVTIDANSDSSGRMSMEVNENGRQIQRTTLDFPTPGYAVAETFTGKTISLNLSNADIKDVIGVFGQLTGIDMVVAPEVKGSVNVNVTGVPWDQAFDSIVRENGYAWRRTEAGIEVFKP